MKFKKIAAAVLAAVMALTLTACSNEQNGESLDNTLGNSQTQQAGSRAVH